MALVMIQYLYLKITKKTFGEMLKSKKIKIDHRYLAFKMLKKKVKIL